jgi:hypothetical protein
MSQLIKLSISNNPKYLGLIRKFFHELLNCNEVPDEIARHLIPDVNEEFASML